MRVLCACEFSGTVRDAFARQGHDAWSCDLLPTETPGNHYQGNVLDILDDGWDLMIAHPPCTDLAVSGSRHFEKKRVNGSQEASIAFFLALTKTSIPRTCIENPVSIMSTIYRKPDQYIHPYYFGDPVSKKTCLWLKNLPLLRSSNVVKPEIKRTKSGKSYDAWWLQTSSLPMAIRGKMRSITFIGLACAMASQWCDLPSSGV